MAITVNFTGSVDRDLLKRAKVIAAKSETSIDAFSCLITAGRSVPGPSCCFLNKRNG
jgi:hypothetical protein